MKEATVICAKLFLILLIIAKPLGLKAVHNDCKHLGNNSCLSDKDCCSGYCYKEPGWRLGVCKKKKITEKPTEKPTGKIDDVFDKGLCMYYVGKDITANGEKFDDSLRTAAHRTLPFDTKIIVETMGSRVVVRINDRKPASDGHILLLSLAAAQSMGIEDKGSVQCQIKFLTNEGCTPNLGRPCLMHYECCSRYCFKEMFSEVGFCIPK